MKKINNRSFLLIHSSIYAIFAIGLFFFPNLLWPNYGVQLNDQYSVFLSQHNSIFLGGIAILTYSVILSIKVFWLKSYSEVCFGLIV